MRNSSLITTLGTVLLGTRLLAGGELQPPMPVLVEGRPLDIEHIGHAAPFMGDFDGDGRTDLLVGEFYQGRLQIYRNVGTHAKPQFERGFVFQDGKASGRIESG